MKNIGKYLPMESNRQLKGRVFIKISDVNYALETYFEILHVEMLHDKKWEGTA